MYLMIDNYDSFVYNLKAYFEELGRDIRVKRCDELTLADIEHMELDGIILSPGPKRPQDGRAVYASRSEIRRENSDSRCVSGASGAWHLRRVPM